MMDRLEQMRREFCDEDGDVDDLQAATGCIFAVLAMLLVAAFAVLVLWQLL